MIRISLLGKKIGMSQIKNASGTHPVTLIQIPEYDIFGIRTLEKDGYNAVILSAGTEVKEKNVAKPLLSQYQKLSLKPREEIFEVYVESQSTIKSAAKGEDDVFDAIDNSYVDITGVTIGKGFAGAMKRWNFAGLEATHGVSISHRSHGSTGQRQDPGRVFKGKKMAGHFGDVQRTIQNLHVISVDKELRIVAVRGAVPGHKNSYVFINDSVKMGRQDFFTKVNNINLVF